MLCDVVREASNDVIQWLEDRNVHQRGAITVDAIEVVVSDAAAVAEAETPGHGTDALVWEEVESRARDDAELSVSFLVFIAIAAVIAAVGILLDEPILIVGAMVVGPDYAPLSALCVAVGRRRWDRASHAAGTLVLGLLVAAGAALLAVLAFRATGLGPGRYELHSRHLTTFISHPHGLDAVVAVLAGVVGMLSVTEGRSGAIIGVLVSVTTIPAVANVGVATAYGEWVELRGAFFQLAINLTGLLVAGIVTLAVQSRVTTFRHRSARREAQVSEPR